MAEQSIEEQVRALAEAGELKTAVTLMVHAYGSTVRAHALYVLRDPELARDAYQATFLDAYRGLHEFRGSSTFKKWLMSIANNRAMDLARKRTRGKKHVVSDAAMPEPADEAALDPIWGLDLPQVLRALDECLQLLSEETRGTVLLRCKEDLSYEEMARGSGERSGTLHARVARALPVLRECLEGKGISL
jgi:RNA polymerase sigma-70 factor, ECF subfamily